MKLFGNTTRKHPLSPPPRPVPAPEPAAQPVQAPVQPVQPVPRPAPVQPAPAAQSTARPKKSHAFRNGLIIYIVLFLALTAAGMALLWARMEVYERSRPQNAMNRFMASNAGRWKELLVSLGMERSHADTLDLSNPESYKLLGEYTDAVPVYGVRFAGKTLLSVSLAPGEPLAFDSNEWVAETPRLRPSGLLVYAPADAELELDGRTVGRDHVAQENAQPVTLGAFEEGREAPGLTRYAMDEIFTVERLTVTDAEGNNLPLSYSSGSSYYYAPLTRSCEITAPSGAAVTVNGVPLTEENAAVTGVPLPDLKEAEKYIKGELPEMLSYTVDGLLLPPEVAATDFAGRALGPAVAEDYRYVFQLVDDPDFQAAQTPRILEVFDAYIAYGTNRNGNRGGNYSKYLSYLVPGSDAAVRAQGALSSVYYAQGRSAALDSVQVTEVIRYAEDLFTAKVDFTLVTDDVENANSYLFVFVPYEGAWRVCSALNK